MIQSSARRVLLLGATGTIGRAVLQELRAQGHQVGVLLRPGTRVAGGGARAVDLRDRAALLQAMRDLGPFDAVISCIAARSGGAKDAWAVDYHANLAVLDAAQEARVGQFILLSAICVQKPRLEFQHAKLAFETALAASGMSYVIVRPTAFFKSLSGQVARVQAGKPFVVFGDGTRTRCKPISDADLARFILRCLDYPADAAPRILPIGGPGPALAPRDQAEILADLLGRAVRLRRVPLGLIGGIAAGLGILGQVNRRASDAAEFARIGQYYATESMLLWDEARQTYDAEATPSFGTETLRAHYAALLRGERCADLGAHAVF